MAYKNGRELLLRQGACAEQHGQWQRRKKTDGHRENLVCMFKRGCSCRKRMSVR
jgi:hypothetical protein